MAGPAYTRMQVDDRRRQLLELGGKLFATHSFDEVSMARIAREAGISKALAPRRSPREPSPTRTSRRSRRSQRASTPSSPGSRRTSSARILDGIGAGDPPPPKLRAAARGWLWFMDGAILDWLDNRDVSKAELRDLLLGSLGGSLMAAGGGDLLSAAASP